MTDHLPTAEDVEEAAALQPRKLIRETPLLLHERLSEKYKATILLKDESKQPIRSYKIRGSYNAIRKQTQTEQEVVCASAGNHAQGTAATCDFLKRPGRIFMPRNTSPLKINATKRWGNGNVEVVLVGDDFDAANAEALRYIDTHDCVLIHPFDNPDIIAGQGTVGLEILKQRNDVYCIVAPVGGGGLISGISTYTKHHAPDVRIYGVEPDESAAMYASYEAGNPVTLNNMSSFIDGAAVRRPGNLTFQIVRQHVDKLMKVPENRVCLTMHELDVIDGMKVELAGALSIDALEDMRDELEGKTVVCVVSGNNFDPLRWNTVIERSEIYKASKIYLRIMLPDYAKSLDDVQKIFPKDVSISYIRYDEQDDETGPNGERWAPVMLGLKSANGGRLPNVKALLQEKGYKFSDVTNDRTLHDMIGH
jgi:threonine dehydratase